MAEKNPTGDGALIALSIPPNHLKFLRATFTMARDGTRDELAKFPCQLCKLRRLQREEAAYGRILAALGDLSMVPDCHVRELVAHVAEVIDSSNEYRRVVEEHDALRGFLDQIEGPSDGA